MLAPAMADCRRRYHGARAGAAGGVDATVAPREESAPCGPARSRSPRFLAAEPTSELRGEAESRLTLLKRAREEAARPKPPSSADRAPAAPSEEGGGRKAWAPWAVAGGGAALAVAGGVLFALGLAARSRVVDARDGARWSELSGDADAAPLLLGGGVVLFLGGAAAAAGGVAWATRSGAGEEAAVVVGPGAISVRGRF